MIFLLSSRYRKIIRTDLLKVFFYRTVFAKLTTDSKYSKVHGGVIRTPVKIVTSKKEIFCNADLFTDIFNNNKQPVINM